MAIAISLAAAHGQAAESGLANGVAARDASAAESGPAQGTVVRSGSPARDEGRLSVQDAGDRSENGSLFAPERQRDYFQAGVSALVVGGGGIAVGAAAELSYVGQGPYRLGLQVSPAVFAFKDGASQGTALVVGEPMLDARLFGLGPALGFATGHGFSGPTVGGKLRFGAIDGFYATLRVSALRKSESQAYPVGAVEPEPSYRLVFAEFDLHLAVPVARRWAMVADASGLVLAFWRASLGVNARLTESQGRGAMFLSINAGAALLDADFTSKPGSDTQQFMGGPLLSLGYTARL